MGHSRARSSQVVWYAWCRIVSGRSACWTFCGSTVDPCASFWKLHSGNFGNELFQSILLRIFLLHHPSNRSACSRRPHLCCFSCTLCTSQTYLGKHLIAKLMQPCLDFRRDGLHQSMTPNGIKSPRKSAPDLFPNESRHGPPCRACCASVKNIPSHSQHQVIWQATFEPSLSLFILLLVEQFFPPFGFLNEEYSYHASAVGPDTFS